MTDVTVEPFDPAIHADLIPPPNHHLQAAEAHDPDYDPALPDVPDDDPLPVPDLDDTPLAVPTDDETPLPVPEDEQ